MIDVNSITDGVASARLKSIKDFNRLTDGYGYTNLYLWRGQQRASWKLEPTFDRQLASYRSGPERHRKLKEHLKKFKTAVRGRRGANPPEIKSDNDWWALGQHNSLATPLLDWTTSPYIALFFAFETPSANKAEDRAVYMLCKDGVLTKSRKGRSQRVPPVEVVSPLSDDNTRLINQSGLFTLAPAGLDIETWVRRAFKGDDETAHLIKATIPDDQRFHVLRTLNQMNINHLSLFPDLYGAAMHCNMTIEVSDY